MMPPWAQYELQSVGTLPAKRRVTGTPYRSAAMRAAEHPATPDPTTRRRSCGSEGMADDDDDDDDDDDEGPVAAALALSPLLLPRTGGGPDRSTPSPRAALELNPPKLRWVRRGVPGVIPDESTSVDSNGRAADAAATSDSRRRRDADASRERREVVSMMRVFKNSLGLGLVQRVWSGLARGIVVYSRLRLLSCGGRFVFFLTLLAS
mmetsp:Transcript_17127/g.49515  ORF Transcript_17127/g.49515 Transcript_17127/m.49515 type:complete len:207 (+) Transcript_17127:1909-2529(+)